MIDRDPLCKAQELAWKAYAAIEMIRAAAAGTETTMDMLGEAAWSVKDQIFEITELLDAAHKNRRTS